MGISFGNIRDGMAPDDFREMPGHVISIPDPVGEGLQMQPQQFMQVPYAQQYAQQGNINDPSVYAALDALNAPAFAAQPTQRYGSGIMEQPAGGGKGGVGQGNVPMIQDWRVMRDHIAARAPVAPAAVAPSDSIFYSTTFGDSMSSGGQGVSNTAADAGLAMMAYPSLAPGGFAVNALGYGIAGQQADAMGRAADNLASIQAADQLGVMSKSDANGNVFSFVTPQSIAAADAATFGPSPDSTGMTTNSAGQTVSNDATIAAQDAATFGSDSGSSGGGGKIVCTAMNHAYGFGSFRQSIWLKYAEQHMTKAHEVGYHAMFLPLVDYGFKQGDALPNRMVRKFLEHVARHRSADLRAEMRGMKRDAIGRAYRFIFEPLCLVVGKLKGY